MTVSAAGPEAVLRNSQGKGNQATAGLPGVSAHYSFSIKGKDGLEG